MIKIILYICKLLILTIMSSIIFITTYDGRNERIMRIVEKVRKYGNVKKILVIIKRKVDTSMLEQGMGKVYDMEYREMDYQDFNSTYFEIMRRIKALIDGETKLIVDLDDTDGVQGYLLCSLSLVYSAKSIYTDENNKERPVNMAPLPERRKIGETKLEILRILKNTPGLDARTISQSYCTNRTYKTIKADLNSLYDLGLVEPAKPSKSIRKPGPESQYYAITDNGERALAAFTTS